MNQIDTVGQSSPTAALKRSVAYLVSLLSFRDAAWAAAFTREVTKILFRINQLQRYGKVGLGSLPTSLVTQNCGGGNLPRGVEVPNYNPTTVPGCRSPRSDMLLRAQMPLGRLVHRVPEQELDLLEIAAVLPAELGAGAAEGVYAEVLDADLLG